MKKYLRIVANGFSAADEAVLAQWRDEFDAVAAWKLIGRNLDEECARKDIDHGLLREFLKDVAQAWSPKAKGDPLSLIDAVLNSRRTHFSLPGVTFSPGMTRLARVIRADHLLKYNLHAASLPIMMDLNALSSAIRTGLVGGKDLAGSRMGRADYPVWVCPDDQLPTTAEDCRDGLGLHHIHHGHMVSITYPMAVLDSDRSALRPPTVLDATANGADNWIFAKRPAPRGPALHAGPGWGHAVDLVKLAGGIDEAVHGDFTIDATKAAQLSLAYVGEISSSAPQVNFTTLLARL